MRASTFFAAPLVAMVAAQSSSTNETSVLSTIPISSSSSSIPYTNGFTSFLTQTNSLGVVTGQPLPATSVGVAATNAAVSSIAVQLVPAGIAPGTVTTLIYGNVTAGNATSIVVTIGTSTTQVLSAAVIAATGSGSASSASGSSGSAAVAASGSSGSSSRRASSSTASRSSGSSASASGSGAAASSTGAAATVNVGAGAGALIAAAAFFAAFM